MTTAEQLWEYSSSDITSEDLQNMFQYPNEREIDVRNTIRACVQNGDTLYYRQHVALGDTLIFSWTNRFVLGKLNDDLHPSEPLKLKSFYTSMRMPEEDYMPHGEALKLIATRFGYGYRYQLPLVEATLRELQMVTGVELSAEDFLRVPLPARLDYSVFSEFDEDSVRKQGEILRRDMEKKHKTLVVIYQAGHIPPKRLMVPHIQEFASHVKETINNAYVVVMTDNQVERNIRPFTLQDQTNAIDDVLIRPDINRKGAVYYASSLTIGTDTMDAWYSNGCKALRDDRNGFIKPEDSVVLYTIADPGYWSIPGIDPVVSQAITYYKRHNPFKFKEGMMEHPLLRNYSYANYFRSHHPSQYQGDCIHRNDILRVKDRITSLSTGHWKK